MVKSKEAHSRRGELFIDGLPCHAAAPKAITLPPSRPVSNSSSTESTLTRELSRHDLTVEVPGSGGSHGSAGNGANGHHPPQPAQHQQGHRGVDPLSFSKASSWLTSIGMLCVQGQSVSATPLRACEVLAASAVHRRT